MRIGDDGDLSIRSGGPFSGVTDTEAADAVFTPETASFDGVSAAYAMACGVDLDSNGTDDLVIGAPRTGDLYEGAAYFLMYQPR
jgi:hypothetical protein